MELHNKIELYQVKLNIVERALERNWNTQIILILLAADSLVNGLDVLRNVAQKVYNAEITPQETKILQIIVAVLLTYTFIRFGFLLRGFVRIRRSCEQLLNQIVPKGDATNDSDDTFLSVFEFHGFFEPYFHVGDYWRDNKVLAILLSLFAAIVMAGNHSMVILMYFSGLPQFYAIVATAVTAALILACYQHFYKSKDILRKDKLKHLFAAVIFIFSQKNQPTKDEDPYTRDARARWYVSVIATVLIVFFTTIFVVFGLYIWVL